MEMLFPLIRQIGIMFVLMAIGFVLYRTKKITKKGSAEMGSVLLYLVIPTVIINSFCMERTPENLKELLASGGVSLIAMALCCLIAWLLYKKDGIACFSAAFSNAAFIGIPLVTAAVGSHAVFYVSAMIVLVNLLQWTFGVFTITKDPASMAPRKILTNPITIGLAIGLCIYIFGIPVPEFIRGILQTIIGLNTPLAMIISGVYLAQVNLIRMFTNKKNYTVSLVRMVLIPLALFLVTRFLPLQNKDMLTAIMIAAAAPVGSNVAVFAQLFKDDYRQAVEYVCMSTLLSVITLPLMIMLVRL